MKNIKPKEDNKESKKQQVEEMFDDISAFYDKANRFISLGMDRRWKKRLIKLLANENPQSILDLATGTADLPLMMHTSGLRNIAGLDLSSGMLEIGKKRIEKEGLSDDIKLLQGDSENLPFSDNYFDAITVSYGLRNYENLSKGLTESLRVLKNNGVFVILETSVPQKFPFKQGYAFFSKVVMPFLGKIFSGNKNAYNYLSESAMQFPCGNDLKEILIKAGFSDVIISPQFFGAASIYICKKQINND